MEINNLCILILSTKSPNYQSFINAIENGWYKEALRNNVKVFFYSGGHSEDVFWNEKERSFLFRLPWCFSLLGLRLIVLRGTVNLFDKARDMAQ
jgi:hypothetical protein